jgi:uncharacterized damage-inducible protein DinB
VKTVWHGIADGDLAYRPHERSSSVESMLQHQLLSERRFFGEFLGLDPAPAAAVLPAESTSAAFIARFEALAGPRLQQLAARDEAWWLEEVAFFDVRRERLGVFWRRVLHTAHHRTQLTVYLRLMDRPVPSV